MKLVSSMANLGRLLIPLLLPLLIWVRLDDHHDDGKEEDCGGDEDDLHLPFLHHLLLVLLLVGLQRNVYMLLSLPRDSSKQCLWIKILKGLWRTVITITTMIIFITLHSTLHMRTTILIALLLSMGMMKILLFLMRMITLFVINCEIPTGNR